MAFLTQHFGEVWIGVAVAAALFQTVRFMLQKQLSQVKLSAAGATFARFVYSAPLAVCLLLIVSTQTTFPPIQQGFWTFGAIGGLAQILATVCTVMLFKQRNFAVGVTFKKTEVLLTAVIGFVILGEVVSKLGALSIAIGAAGVLVLSRAPADRADHDAPKKRGWRKFVSPSVVLGLTAGALFGVSAVTYRAASLTVMTDAPFLRALITLAAVTSMQMIGMGLWLLWRDRVELGRVLAAWRTAGWIGIFSMAGTFCWFTAFTLQNAAYVKAVGQVELIFSLIASVVFFREKITLRELSGIALISASVLGVVLAI